MATIEEQEELLETIKNEVKYYRISISGYGGESAYMSISKEAHDFWSKVVEEHGDGDLVHYMVSAEDGEFDFDDIDSVPSEADFLKWEEDGEVYRSSWYEAPTEFEHTFGATYDSSYITIEEVEGIDYGGTVLDDIVDCEDTTEFVERIGEETDWETEINQYEVTDSTADYVCQFYSAEKGTFFEGTFETRGKFDFSKLKITATEYLNGEDTITSVTYDGEEVENFGGDTNGKGYYASVWSNK